MEHLSSAMEQQEQQQLQWRRDKVQELCSKGYSQREDITNSASWTGYCKQRYIVFEKSSQIQHQKIH